MSSDLNRNIMQGRLVKAAELKELSNTFILKFTIASNKSYKDKTTNEWKTRPTFMDCVVWGKYAESLAKHLTKGKLITVEGETEQNTWEDDNGKHSKHQIKVDAVYGAYTGSKKDEPLHPEGKEIPTADTIGEDDIPF